MWNEYTENTGNEYTSNRGNDYTGNTENGIQEIHRINIQGKYRE